MSQHAIGAIWRALAARIFVFCFALASVTQGSLAIAPEGDRLQPDPASKITSPEPGAALLIGAKDRKLTAERPGGFERAAVAGRQNLLQAQKRFAFRAGHDRLIQGTALLRVVAVRGPPRRSYALDNRHGRFVDGELRLISSIYFARNLRGS